MWEVAGLIAGATLLFVVALILTIALHEFGHALAARVTGTRVLL